MVPRRLLASVLISAALPAGASAATIGEQVDRQTGVAGGTILAGGTPTPRWVSDDGRFVLFDEDVRGPARASQTAGERSASGVYLRDTVADTSTQLAKGNVRTTNLTSDLKTISVVTSEALTAADTDGTPDLYLIDVASRAPTLFPTGTGFVRDGAISTDGSAVVWSDADGTWRRPAAVGAAAVRLSTKVMPGVPSVGATAYLPEQIGGLRGRQSISRDGSAVGFIVEEPAGGISVTLHAFVVRLGKADVPLDTGSSPFLSPDGNTAYAIDRQGATTLRAYDVNAGGAAHDVADSSAIGIPYLTDVSTDGRTLALFDWQTTAMRTVDTSSGATSAVGPALPSVATSSRTLLSANGAFEAATTPRGHLMLVPTGATPLPEAPDLPSPLSWVGFDLGCTRSPYGISSNRRPSFAVLDDTFTPTAASARLVFRSTSGIPIGTYTVRPGAGASVPLGWVGNWVLDATVTLADGRSLTARWTQGPYSGTDSCDWVGYF